jgi:hypothetical protein
MVPGEIVTMPVGVAAELLEQSLVYVLRDEDGEILATWDRAAGGHPPSRTPSRRRSSRR